VSKYDELVDVCNESTKECIRLKDEAHDFAAKLIAGIINYLDVPEGNSQYVERGSQDYPAVPSPLFKVMRFDDDTVRSWSFGLELSFTCIGKPMHVERLGFVMKKSGENFTVTIDNGSNSHELNLQDTDALQRFYEDTFYTLKHQIGSFERVLNNDA
jgi:hypothetical protein